MSRLSSHRQQANINAICENAVRGYNRYKRILGVKLLPQFYPNTVALESGPFIAAYRGTKLIAILDEVSNEIYDFTEPNHLPVKLVKALESTYADPDQTGERTADVIWRYVDILKSFTRP